MKDSYLENLINEVKQINGYTDQRKVVELRKISDYYRFQNWPQARKLHGELMKKGL